MMLRVINLIANFLVNDYKNNCDKRKLAIKCGISWDGVSDNYALQEHCNNLNY